MDIMTFPDLSQSDSVDLETRVQFHTLPNALEPLKDITAQNFEVELNVEPSEETWERLGKIDFMTTKRRRPYNVEVYGENAWLPVRGYTKREMRGQVFVHPTPGFSICMIICCCCFCS